MTHDRAVDESQLIDQRRQRRVDASFAVDVMQNGARVGVGKSIDISAGGIRFISYCQLRIGSVYRICASSWLSLNAKIVRKIGMQEYGAEFLLNDFEKRELNTAIKALEAGKTPAVSWVYDR